MNDVLTQIEPRALWGYFASILEIPRPSKHEERIAAWIRGIAEQHGWTVRADRAGNLVIDVPASPGFAHAPVVILQSHLDMVCEKHRDTIHDFTRDAIEARVDGEWVHAVGTTLGADNGIGIAAALAAATDATAIHGPLQLVFTVDEETGLNGAARIDPTLLTGRLLLNLDSEEDGVLCAGCAGGGDAQLTLRPATTAPTPGSRAHRLLIHGLRGGHSGIDIDSNRGNAIRFVARTLVAALDSGVPLELAWIRGGSKHNAIPREAEAGFFLADGDSERFRSVLSRTMRAFRNEVKGVDDGLDAIFEPTQHEGWALERASRNTLLHILAALPHGVLGLSHELDGMVETSACLAVVDGGRHEIRIVASARSAVGSRLDDVLGSVRAIGTLAGAKVKTSDVYPGWRPNPESRLLRVMRGVCADVWGEEPVVGAVHAGLECGLIGRKVPDMDMLSIGPQIEGAHSPDECVHIPSVGRFWAALRRGLEVLARGEGVTGSAGSGGEVPVSRP